MPNGVSCAYFAIRNYIYGQKEKNIFKEGIAGAQTTRVLDTVANSGMIKNPAIKTASGKLSSIASFAKKILYPLIIGSGIYNTIKSDDKVKTGVSQAGGIFAMYKIEKLAEKGLNIVNTKVMNLPAVKSNKWLQGLCYLAKGAGFAAASIAGYNLGSKGGSQAVDIMRKITHKHNVYENFPMEDDLIKDNIESTLFEEIKL